MIKVSVIIPVYNCQEYIDAAVESVCEQTCSELEILVIDDGSTDETQEHLRILQELHPQIQLITIEHGGPAKARNVGIEKATGQYFYFMDADDIIDPQMLSQLFAVAQRYKLDAVACGYQTIYAQGSREIIKYFGYEEFLSLTKAAFENRLIDMIKSQLMFVVWNKLYSAELVRNNQITFPDYMNAEDRLFNLECFAHVKNFAFIDQPYYHKFIRAGLSTEYIENRFEAVTLYHYKLLTLYKEWGKCNEQNKNKIDYVYIKSIIECFAQLYSDDCFMSTRERLQYVVQVMNNNLVDDAIRSYDKDVRYSRWINLVLRTKNPSLILTATQGLKVVHNWFGKQLKEDKEAAECN